GSVDDGGAGGAHALAHPEDAGAVEDDGATLDDRAIPHLEGGVDEGHRGGGDVDGGDDGEDGEDGQDPGGGEGAGRAGLKRRGVHWAPPADEAVVGTRRVRRGDGGGGINGAVPTLMSVGRARPP